MEAVSTPDSASVSASVSARSARSATSATLSPLATLSANPPIASALSFPASVSSTSSFPASSFPAAHNVEDTGVRNR